MFRDYRVVWAPRTSSLTVPMTVLPGLEPDAEKKQPQTAGSRERARLRGPQITLLTSGEQTQAVSGLLGSIISLPSVSVASCAARVSNPLLSAGRGS